MTGALWTELVVVEDLAPADREAFLDELGALVSTIFVNYGRDYLAKDMAAPHLASARVLMMRDGDGQLVGYNQVRRFAYQIDGRTVHMFRAMAGLLPEYRGRGSTLTFGLAQAFRFKLAHPLAEVYFLPILLHPTSSRHTRRRPFCNSSRLPPELLSLCPAHGTSISAAVPSLAAG